MRTAVIAMGLALFLAPAGHAVRKPDEFRAGIKAQNLGDWEGSIPLLRLSLEKQKEDGERVRISSTNYRRYLPHYYLGLAFYRQNNCADARKEWEKCLEIGAVLNTDEHTALLSYLAEIAQGRCPSPRAGRSGAREE